MNQRGASSPSTRLVRGEKSGNNLHSDHRGPSCDGRYALCVLRFPVATVVAMVADGMSAQEIIAEHPDLELGDVAEALKYAAEALKERELSLRKPA